MRCKVCSDSDTYIVFEDPIAGQWHRCVCCGSDSQNTMYEDVSHNYNAAYVKRNFRGVGTDDLDVVIDKLLRADLDWFEDYRHYNNNAGRGVPAEKDFLDVGFLEGAALKGMQDRKWSVHGFDVIPAAKLGDHTTIAPFFSANALPQKYAAVLARHVLANVGDWRRLLMECHAVTHLGGLFQIISYRPTVKPAAQQPGYEHLHLQLITPAVLRYWLEKLGFAVLDFRLTGDEQAFFCQKVDG